MTTNQELLPCPFCGNPVELEKTIDHREWWGVICRGTSNKGGSCAMHITPSGSKETAIARWNMRTDYHQSKPTQKLLKAAGMAMGALPVGSPITEHLAKAITEINNIKTKK